MRRDELEACLLAQVEASRAEYIELRGRFQCAASLCHCCPELDALAPFPPPYCALAEARERYREALAAFTAFVLDGVSPRSLTG